MSNLQVITSYKQNATKFITIFFNLTLGTLREVVILPQRILYHSLTTVSNNDIV